MRTRKINRRREKEGEPKKRRRGAVEEGDTSTAAPLSKGYLNKFKLDSAKDRKLIYFPLVTEEGGIKIKTMDIFTVKFGKKLSDGKWHNFHMPEDDELYEACLEHPSLEVQTIRFALLLEIGTDDKGNMLKSKDCPYSWSWLKMTDSMLDTLGDLELDAEDLGADALSGVDIKVKADRKGSTDKYTPPILYVGGKSVVLRNKLEATHKDIVKEAEELWSTLEFVVAPKEEDDVIEALIDSGEDEEAEDRAGRRGGRAKRKKKFNKKDF